MARRVELLSRGRPVDLQWARAGYLRYDRCHIRFVVGLDQLAEETLRIGARFWWGELPESYPGLCYWDTHQIVLAPWLFHAMPYFIRKVWSHELAHCVVGGNEERVQFRQASRYGDLLLPAWAA